jgi:hypothetical protein
MTKNFRQTMTGQVVDMDQLREIQGNTIAIGNMSVNGKGDVVNRQGDIITKRKDAMKKVYTSKPVSYVPPRRRATTDATETVEQPQQSLAEQVSNEMAMPTPQAPATTEPRVIGTPTRPVSIGEAAPSSPFGPRAADLRGALASDVSLSLAKADAINPRTIRKI